MRSRGFTLTEVLVVLGLVVVLAGSMFSFLVVLLDQRFELVERTEATRAAAVLVERIEEAAATVVAGDPRVGAGVTGTADSIELLHRTVGASLGAEPATLRRLVVGFDAGLGAYTASDSGVDETASGGPLHPSITAVRFRYLVAGGGASRGSWNESFDSSTGLPAAIEVSVWIETDRDAASALGNGDGLVDPLAGEFGGIDPAFGVPGAIGRGDSLFGAPVATNRGAPPPGIAPDRQRIIVIADGVPPPTDGLDDRFGSGEGAFR